jgi:hypothetical protein
MKILFTNQIYEELVINLMVYYRNTTYVKRKENALDMNNILYRLIVNSSIIEDKIKSILFHHMNGEYNKAYDSLVYQSDVISEFYDGLVKLLLEIEYLEYSRKLSLIYEYTYDMDGSFFKNEYNLDSYRQYFLKRRSKIIKFFNIDILTIIKKVDSYDYNCINDHINYLLNVIIDMLNVYIYL